MGFCSCSWSHRWSCRGRRCSRLNRRGRRLWWDADRAQVSGRARYARNIRDGWVFDVRLWAGFGTGERMLFWETFWFGIDLRPWLSLSRCLYRFCFLLFDLFFDGVGLWYWLSFLRSSRSRCLCSFLGCLRCSPCAIPLALCCGC